jgi:hypothetical protein
MFAIGLLVLVAILAAVLVTGRRVRSSQPAPMPGGLGALPLEAPGPSTGGGTAEQLDRWVRAGLLSDAQRTAILAHEAHGQKTGEALAPVPPGPGRISTVAEALGYLGGVLALSGLGLIISHYWPDLATAARLGLSGAVAIALAGAGALTEEAREPALARLRGFLWLMATAATGLFAGIVAAEVLDTAAQTQVLAGASSIALVSWLMWQGRDRPLQQLTFLGGLVVTAGALMSEVVTGGPVGLAVWLAGATLVGLGLRRRTPEPVLTEGVGVLAVVVGATMAASDWEGRGLLFLVATAFGLLALATGRGLAPARADRMVLGIVGAFALVQAAPATIGWYSEEAGGITGLAVWAIGATLLAIGARGPVLLPVQTELLGGAGLLGGAALTATDWPGFAHLFGLATAVALVALGTLPGQVVLSVLGSVGLLINVPWAISWFFPGEELAPLLIMVSGILIIGIAVAATRMRGRLHEDAGPRRGPPPRGMPQPGGSH